MSANPTRQIITGVGTPRLMRDMPSALWTSAASTTTYGVDYLQDTSGISTSVLLGMRISATLRVNTGGQDFDFRCYGKVVELDVPNNRYYVNDWVGGTPTNGIAGRVEGWIADLPRTLKDGIRETFTPLLTVHKKFRNRKGIKTWGWGYSALLDYDQRFTPDDFFELRHILQQSLEGTVETLLFIPRRDVPGFNYEVYIDQDLDIALHESQDFHKGLSIHLDGREPVAAPPFILFGGYGTGYAQKYGIQL